MNLKAIIFRLLIICVAASLTTNCGKHVANNEPIDAESSNDVDSAVETVFMDDNEETDDIDFPLSNSPEDMQRFMTESPEHDKYSEGIIPDILKESPEYAYKLLCNKFDRFIIVDKGRMKVILFDKFGRTEKTYGMACAKNYGTKQKKGDSCTPEGFFSVEGTYDSTDWLFTDDDGVTSEKKGQFGPRFIRLRIPSTSQIGIHGTCAPWSIGHRSSHGCIRIKNENILELVECVEPGMPVIVIPGKKDMESNAKNNVEITWIPTIKGARKPVINVPTETIDATKEIQTSPTDSLRLDSIDNVHISQPDTTIHNAPVD